MRRLTPAHYRSMPWKNGLGTTTELWREDDAAGEMLWRVSIAGVAQDGPFSPFPGFERHIMVLTGDGMVLDGAPQGTIRVAPALSPRRFSGDWAISARLLGGPLTDFNLMVRRAWGHGELVVLDGSTIPHAALPAGTRFLWIESGHVSLGAERLATGEACLMEPGEDFTLVPSPGSRIVACVVQPAR